MPIPTPVAGSPWQSSWSVSTSPKLAPTSGSWVATIGTQIVVEMMAENGDALFANPPTNAATGPATIVWDAQRRNIGVVNSVCRGVIWTGAVTVAGNVQISVATSANTGPDVWGMIVWAFSAHGGIGQTLAANGTTGPTGTPGSPWSAGSAVCCGVADFAAAAIATRAYRTNLGAATEDNAINVDGNYSTYAWHHADSGAGGSVAIGMTAPSQTWTLLGTEVLAAPNPADNTTKPGRLGMFTPQLRQDGWF